MLSPQIHSEMSTMKIFVFILCVTVLPNRCVKLPPNFLKCNRHQPNLEKCVLKAAQHGIAQMYRPYKKMGLPNAEPLKLVKISAHVDTNLIKLDEQLLDCKFYGMSKGKFNSIKFDLNHRFLSANVTFPLLETSCHYISNGTILSFPFSGDGPSWLNFTNFNISIDITYDEIVTNNKTYVKITTCKVDGKPENLLFRIDNLFNGDEVAGRRMNELINENWSELYDDIKDEYLDIPSQIIASIMSGFFSRLSLEELFD